jgi:cytochrome P450
MADDASGLRFVPPGPGPASGDPNLLQMMWRSMSRPLEAWPRAVFEAASYRPPVPMAPLFLMDPELVGTVFAAEADGAFSQGALFRRIMRPIWGDGILTSQGPGWRWQRRASAPAFRPAHMHALAPFMAGAAQAALDRWAPRAEIELFAEATRITLDVILDTVLSGGEDFDRVSARSRVGAFASQALSPRLSFYLAPDAWHEGREFPSPPGADGMRRDVAAMLRRRREAPPRGDLIDLLLQARDPETDQAMDDELLCDNLLGFIMAGHQTSSVALTWSIYLAASHAPTAARLLAEAAEVVGQGPIGAAHVEQLVFTRQVVSEALRLYPPGFQLYRVCLRPVAIGDHKLRPGDKVLIPVYALHRHRRFWRDPDAFVPGRFAPGEPTPDRRIYMPFGAGGRSCLGAAFAMTELVVMLATLMRGAEFAVKPGQHVWPGQGLEMAPRGGIPMQARVL